MVNFKQDYLLKHIYNWLERTLIYFSSGCMVLLLIVLLWQVLSRYLLKTPSTMTEELSRLLLIGMASTGAVLSFMRRKHLALDLLYQKSSPPLQKVLTEISAIAIFILGFILMVGGVLLIREKWDLGQTSAVLGFELIYFYFLIPICGFIIMISPFQHKEEN